MSNHQLVTGSEAAAELVPASVAYENHIVPLYILADTLVVATASPFPTESQQCLHFILNRNVRGVFRSVDGSRLGNKSYTTINLKSMMSTLA